MLIPGLAGLGPMHPTPMAVLAVLLLLAGCASHPAPAPAPTPSTATVVAQQPGAAHAPPLTGPCSINRTAVNTALGYGVNPDGASGQKVACSFSEVAGLPAANLTRFREVLVEAQWQAQSTETAV